MNDIATRMRQLPDTLEDLSQFVLVSKAKLDAYRVKLRAVNRLSDAQEIREQTFQEAQEVANALIAAETRIGELLLSIPKASGQYAESENRPISKNTVVAEMGYSKDQASDYQRMAQNPAIINLVLEKAEREGKVVSHAQVMKKIKEKDAEIEKIQTGRQIVEVFPDDYNEKSAKARAYDADVGRLNRKLNQVSEEKRQLQEQIAELKEASQEGLEHSNLSENVYYFCTLANNFVGNAGGLVWLTSRINDMPDKEKELFIKAASALCDFSQVFAQNMERMKTYDKSDSTVGRRQIPTFPD